MPRVKLTPEVLEEKAEVLREKAARNNDVLDQLDNLMRSLVSDWEGDAQRAFEESYNAKRASFQNFTVDMDKFANFLKKFADTMKQEEARQADKARGLA